MINVCHFTSYIDMFTLNMEIVSAPQITMKSLQPMFYLFTTCRSFLLLWKPAALLHVAGSF